MEQIAATDFRRRIGEYAHLIVAKRRSYVVTSQGRPIFRAVPVDLTVEELLQFNPLELDKI